MEVFLFFLFFLACLPFVLAYNNQIIKNHNKATGDIINHDTTMRKFVYKINLSQNEIIDLLKTKNASDELSCTFNFDKSIIRFSEYGSHRDYYFQVE